VPKADIDRRARNVGLQVGIGHVLIQILI
jgi:hypothetical protein